MTPFHYIGLSSILLLTLPAAHAAGNTTQDSFNKAKRTLERSVYADHRETLYCGATFTAQKAVISPPGFTSKTHVKRAKRIEWEHVVPAENFGRTFTEWRDGHPACVDNKGRAFKGRKCAEKTNTDYRHMQSDMYNLFPAIGSVNALRSNYNFTLLPNVNSDFGACAMKIDDRKAEPPAQARGRIARTYLYMDAVYPRYKLSRQQAQLMQAWDKQYPTSPWECTRAKRIEALQGNVNPIMAARCQE
jgi:deoxyribonuclease-1